jgi:hypothetical protein
MAVFHAMAMLKEGANPQLGICPLHPGDIVAGSEQEALEEARSLMNDTIGECAEASDDDAADKLYAAAKALEPHVVRVNRPSVNVEPRSWTTDAVHEGAIVGTLYNYGNETGEQSFDVLLDGKITGLLLERRRPMVTTEGQPAEKRGWCLSKASGALAPVVGREWEEDRPVGEGDGFAWPGVALAGIRGALESQNSTSAP